MSHSCNSFRQQSQALQDECSNARGKRQVLGTRFMIVLYRDIGVSRHFDAGMQLLR